MLGGLLGACRSTKRQVAIRPFLRPPDLSGRSLRTPSSVSVYLGSPNLPHPIWAHPCSFLQVSLSLSLSLHITHTHSLTHTRTLSQVAAGAAKVLAALLEACNPQRALRLLTAAITTLEPPALQVASPLRSAEVDLGLP